MVCTAIALNDLYGCSAHLTERRPGKVHAAALRNLRDKVKRFLLGEGSRDFTFEQVVADLKEKKVSYTGEEVSRPICLTAEQIQQSLPPRGHGGSIPVTRFLRGRIKHLMENPLESLLPLRERNTGPMQAKVHIEKGAEMEVFELLEERGVITWLPESEVFRDETGECLNGLFGVVKQGKSTLAGRPVLRVIMNLVPANRLFEVIHGDVQLLPNGTSWIPWSSARGKSCGFHRVTWRRHSTCTRSPRLGNPSSASTTRWKVSASGKQLASFTGRAVGCCPWDGAPAWASCSSSAERSY